MIHLGHNRGVAEVVRAAIQEDADAIAVSSYQGGHVEYFRYMVDMLRERGAGHIRVFGGGGGTITPPEIAELRGVRRRADLPPERRARARADRDDRRPRRAARAAAPPADGAPEPGRPTTTSRVAEMLSAIEDGVLDGRGARRAARPRGRRRAPARRSSGSPAPAAPARAPSPTRSLRASARVVPAAPDRRSSPSTRRAAAPAARCSATASG